MAIKKSKALMKVLMVMAYEGHPVYVRMVGKNVFMWDVIINNQLYGNYIVMDPAEGKVKLRKDEINEVVKMCYAGAATTVDLISGKELPKTDQDMLDKFDKAVKILEVNGYD